MDIQYILNKKKEMIHKIHPHELLSIRQHILFLKKVIHYEEQLFSKIKFHHASIRATAKPRLLDEHEKEFVRNHHLLVREHVGPHFIHLEEYCISETQYYDHCASDYERFLHAHNMIQHKHKIQHTLNHQLIAIQRLLLPSDIDKNIEYLKMAFSDQEVICSKIIPHIS